MASGAASHRFTRSGAEGISGLLGFRVKWNEELLLLRRDACGCTDLALRAEGNSKMCLTRGKGEDREDGQRWCCCHKPKGAKVPSKPAWKEVGGT